MMEIENGGGPKFGIEGGHLQGPRVPVIERFILKDEAV
jgi:hypothetical protein